MIKLKDNVISINKSRKISFKQRKIIDTLSALGREKYLKNLLGNKSGRVHIPMRLESRHYEDNLRVDHGEVLRYFRNILNNESDMNHKPFKSTKTSQYIGVEIECNIEGCCFGGGCGCDDEDCCIDGDNDSEVLIDFKDALTRAKVKNCSVRSDGSLNTGGVEICMLFDAAKGFDNLKRLCKVLSDFGATIDSDCGLHIHIDQKDLGPTEVCFKGDNFAKFLPLMLELQPKSRRDNSYCKPVVSTSDRYSAINLCAWQKLKTIEIRLHSGTVHFSKISNWIKLWLAIDKQYSKKELLLKVYTLADFESVLELPDGVLDFYTKQHKRLNPDQYSNIYSVPAA